METNTTNWWLLDDGEIIRKATKPAMRAMAHAGLHGADIDDAMSITFTALLRIAESRRNGGEGGEGLKSLAYRVALHKALRPLKSEMVQRQKCELLTQETVTWRMDDATGNEEVRDPLDVLDAGATARKLTRPETYRPLPPYAGIDARAFIDSLGCSERALLADLVACGDTAQTTAARLSLATGEVWTVRRVKRVRARLREAWRRFFQKKIAEGGGRGGFGLRL